MKRRRIFHRLRVRQGGFSLVELVVSMALTAGIAAASLILFVPSIRLFANLTDQEKVRQEVIAALESVGREASTVRALYIDATKCYALCMEYVDTSNLNHRILYFWSGANLMRKKQLTSAGALSCTSGGVQFVGNLNNASTNFSMDRELLKVNMSAIGAQNTYQLSAVFMPLVKEREILFTEGFECNTLTQGGGWTKTNGTHSSWQLVAGTQGYGSYEISHVMTASGSDTASIETAIDMTRYPKALLTFSYRNDVATALTGVEGLYIDWYSGTSWGNVYAHDLAAGAPPTATTIVRVDVTDYGLVAGSKLRYRVISANAASRWYVDNIKVASP